MTDDRSDRQAENLCGNKLHPDGPWHPATPHPPTWRLLARWRYRNNRRAWGCGCDARPRPP